MISPSAVENRGAAVGIDLGPRELLELAAGLHEGGVPVFSGVFPASFNFPAH